MYSVLIFVLHLSFQLVRDMFSRIPNLQIHEFFHNFSCFILKQGRIFLLKSKTLLKLFIFTQKRHFAAPLKENKTFFMKKFVNVNSEFVKICHEQV